MATRLAAQTGNWSSSSTWKLVDSTSALRSESNHTALTSSYVESASFTPGAITVEGIAVYVYSRASSPSGTFSTRIAQGGATVTGTETTINVSDVPSMTAGDGTWVYFKFSSPVTLAGATAYTVSAKTSNSSQVNLYRDSTAGNWARMLVTSTTGNMAAGDDCYIVRHFTGAGTGTDIAVTMDETSSTDYGSNTTSVVTPAVGICKGGTLTFGTSASTNYVLKVLGHLVIYCGGTLSIGTTGTPIPSTSTAKLQFGCSADGDFGIYVKIGGTFYAQGSPRTTAKLVTWCKLNTDEAIASTSLGVDTDTGWLDNDEIVIASTTRTYSQAEKGTLNGNAGASTLTVDGFGGAGGGLAYAHDGTAPVQAEIGLLTRNVLIESASSTAMSFVYIRTGTTCDFDWVEFRYLGENASGKRGIEIETTTGTFEMHYCSLHDCEDWGFYAATTSTNNVTIEYSVFYNLNTAAASNTYPIYIVALSATNTSKVNNNLFIYLIGTSSSNIVYIRTPILEFKNNVITSCGGSSPNANNGALSLEIYNITYTQITDCSGCIFHSNSHNGITITGPVKATSLTSYRNSQRGIRVTGYNVTLGSIVVFGNTTANLEFAGGTSGIVQAGLFIDSLETHGDTSFSTTNGIQTDNYNTTVGNSGDIFIKSYNSAASGIKTAPTNDFNVTLSRAYIRATILNAAFAATNEIVNFPSYCFSGSYLAIQKYDRTAGDHRYYAKYGTARTDTTIYSGASPSLRMTPNDASNVFEMTIGHVNVNNGQTCTPSVKVRESVVGDGTDYNGGRAVLIVKANPSLGINSDTTLDTATVSSEGSWETLTGTTAAVNDDGVLEFAIQCTGTTGWVNVDDLSATLA